MSRIRTIKPEWRTDRRMMRAGLEARVLSIALITLADDEGRGLWFEPVIAAEVFGNDPDRGLASLSRGLASLSGWFVQVYEVDGEGLFQIQNWRKHQKIDRPTPSRLPPPPAPENHISNAVLDASRVPREDVARPREENTSGPRTLDLGSGILDQGGAPPSPSRGCSEATELRTEQIRASFSAAFRATGERAPPWLNGLTNEREWGELRTWLADTFPGAEVATAAKLAEGFARNAFAKKRGHPFRGGNGSLMHGPGEFLEVGHAQPSSFDHVTRSALDRLPKETP